MQKIVSEISIKISIWKMCMEEKKRYHEPVVRIELKTVAHIFLAWSKSGRG